MPYSIKKVKGSRPFQIVNTQTGRVVGTSVTRSNAQNSIAHRMSAEKKVDIKYFKRSVDNKMHGYGETDLEKKKIRINKSKKKNKEKGEILDTIVHEVHHVNHPKMHEKNIRKLSKKSIKHMTRKQKQKKYSLFRS